MSFNYIETLEKADINISSLGDNTPISAPGAGKYICIDFLQYIVNGAVVIQYKDGSTNYGGAMTLVSQMTVTAENSMMNEHGVITLSDNSAFVMNLSAAVQVSGFIRYRIINK